MSDERILLAAEELLEQLDDPDWVVVDCRSELGDPDAGRRAYEEAHIAGAVFLDLDRDLAGPVSAATGRHPLPDVDLLVGKLGQSGIGKSRKVVVYDAGHGAIAARTWWTLRWLGHDAVHLLDGGLARWQVLDLPMRGGAEAAEPQVFHAAMRNKLVMRTEELATDIASIPACNLLDARDRPRFLGETEPIDPVAGHIPGAISLPFTDFVREDGTWRSIEERGALLEEAIGTDREVAWSVMCGSGVTACHLAISGIEAGFTDPRVYVGSWSEWIRDPGRPIAVGDR